MTGVQNWNPFKKGEGGFGTVRADNDFIVLCLLSFASWEWDEEGKGWEKMRWKCLEGSSLEFHLVPVFVSVW